MANNQVITSCPKNCHPFQQQLSVPSFREIQKLQQDVETEEKQIEKWKASCVIFNKKENLSTFIPQLCTSLNIKLSDITTSEVINSAKREGYQASKSKNGLRGD